MRAPKPFAFGRKRAVAYKLFAEAYYPPEERSLVQAERIVRELSGICPEAETAIALMASGLAAAEGEVEELATDHARLFVGPFALLAPPYGSVYLDRERRLMGDSTLEVEAFYREAGLEVAEGFPEPPDHVVVELEYMHFLACQEINARRSGDPAAGRFRHLQRTFLDRHLGAWLPDFTHRVEAQALTRFYRGLAAATRIFVAHDALRLSQPHNTPAGTGGGDEAFP